MSALPDGSTWLGSYEDGLVRWSPRHGLRGRWTSDEGLPSDRVWSLAADSHRPERVWVGTERGLAAIERDRVVRPVPGQLTIDEPVRLIHADPSDRGSLWYAGNAGGRDELRNGRRIAWRACGTQSATPGGAPPPRGCPMAGCSRDVIDTSPNPIFVRDGDGTYALANRAAAAVWRPSPRGAVGAGRTVREDWHEPDCTHLAQDPD